jgi:hypothetical protein
MKKASTTRTKTEKKQISVRIRKEIMDSYYALAESDEMKITDMIEEGFYLAVQQRLKLPIVTKQARYLVTKASLDDQWLHILFDVYLHYPLPPVGEFDREALRAKLYWLSKQEDFNSVLSTLTGQQGPVHDDSDSARAHGRVIEP